MAIAAAANPSNPNILNSYGIELASAGDLMGAITIWRRALDYDRSNVHLYNNIGSALKRLGHDEHAYAWYAAALQLKPVYWTFYNLAILYRDHAQYEEADWALGESLKLNPEFREAKDMLQRIRAGQQNQASFQANTFPAKPPVGQPVTPLPKPDKSEIQVCVPEPARIAEKKHTARHKPPKSPPTTISEPLQMPSDTGGQVFLTFDGGATDAGFDSIIESLRRYSIKCTFFLTGQFARNYPDKCRQLIAAGHEIGNHSMNHPDMKNFSAEKIATEIEATESAFSEVIGQRGARFFRFPFGHQNQRVERIVENIGYRPVYWHIDTIDWREDPVNTIIGRVKKKLCRNSVILMHLGSKNGARALDSILQTITGRGYTLARLSDMDATQLATLP